MKNLKIIIEKLDTNIEFPYGANEESVKFTHSGIELNGRLHFWDDILFVSIINRGLSDSLKL